MANSNKEKVTNINTLLKEVEQTLFGLEDFKEEDAGSAAKRKGIEFHKSIYEIKLKLLGAEPVERQEKP